MKKLIIILAFVLLFDSASFSEEISPVFSFKIPTAGEEAAFINNLIRNMKFYYENGYQVGFPKELFIEKELQQLISKSCSSTLSYNDFTLFNKLYKEKIYDAGDYQAAFNRIDAEKLNVVKAFPVFKKYHDLWGFKIPKEYTAYLTLYGPGGNYNLEKGYVILKTSQYGGFEIGGSPLPVILHEMTHIGIEEVIVRKYKLSQGQKERIVDKFVQYHFKDMLPNYPMGSHGDVIVDEYLDRDNSWDNLPAIAEEILRKQN